MPKPQIVVAILWAGFVLGFLLILLGGPVSSANLMAFVSGVVASGCGLLGVFASQRRHQR